MTVPCFSWEDRCGVRAAFAVFFRDAATKSSESGFALDRWYKALERLNARERRSLENKVRRQVRDMEAARKLRMETLQDNIEVNKLDDTLPAGELHAAGKKQKTNTWKARTKKLAKNIGQKQTRPKGHRHSRGDR